ncbi:hypothetical protein SNE40_019775 [Patella caerulea]|uniref:exodeoxyribonuclease III n=1 Tax=Patella caerulea TaxID=87958 RepID=A0AAN8PGG1_PATCE
MQSLFALANSLSAGILCLQETFWDADFINENRDLWDGSIYHSCDGTSKRRGCAILVSKLYTDSISSPVSDNVGRFVKCSFKYDKVEFDIVSCYAPNSVKEQNEFYRYLCDSIDHDSSYVLCGDFNDVVDPFCDRSKTLACYGSATSRLNNLISKKNLIDVWRYFHPKKSVYEAPSC